MDTATYTEQQMIAIGGERWTGTTVSPYGHSSDHLRVYLNDWADMVNLNIDHYDTGNVRSATLHGGHISNGRATKLAQAKVYWEDGTIHLGLLEIGAARANVDFDALADTLAKAVASRVAVSGH